MVVRCSSFNRCHCLQTVQGNLGLTRLGVVGLFVWGSLESPRFIWGCLGSLGYWGSFAEVCRSDL